MLVNKEQIYHLSLFFDSKRADIADYRNNFLKASNAYKLSIGEKNKILH